ncbi:MAG TPA: AsmA family protein [Hyphomicrobium sp.]|nr:AsmA family protein [Hyphomicrobium sp.]
MYLIALVLIVVGAGVGYLMVNPPSELIRTTIARQVKEKTGRDLIVSGPAAFSFYPGLGVTLQDVSLSGPPGSQGNLVTMASLDVNIKTMPLINRNVEVRRIVVRQPVFDLRVDKAGKKNWNFAELLPPIRYAQADVAPDTATDVAPPSAFEGNRGISLPKSLNDIDHLQFDDVRIEDGTVRYTDDRSGKSQEVSAINVKLALQSLQAPLTVIGDLGWHGEKLDFNAKLTSAKAILEERPARLVVAAQNRHLNSSFDGNVLVKDGADVEGQLTTKSESVRDLAQWLGTTLPVVPGFGPLSIAGQLKTNGNVTSLSNANFGLDGATATGNVSVTTGGVRPYVKANLRLSELDLNKYMTGAGGVAAKASPVAAPAAAPALKPSNAAPDAGQEADQIENLLKSPATKVYGYTQRDGWSSTPFNMELFGLADSDAKLQVGRLKFNAINVGASSLTVALKNRVMKTSFDEVQLYDGHGKGFLNVDATGKAANIGANFALDGLSALPFLTDAADMKWLSGKAKIGMQLAASGSNPLQLVETLNGKTDVKFADGAIVGFNVPGAIRGISQGKLSGIKTAPSEKTDFSELSASFNVVNGVAQNQDLQMVSPLLRVTGAGAVHLPPRTVDYTIKPKIVASLQGQQGAQGLNGLEIPVRISGPWAKPNIEPDLKGVLSDPNKAMETVKEIGKQFKGKNANEIVDQLLGKKSGDTSSGSSSNAKDLLNKFLKPQ